MTMEVKTSPHIPGFYVCKRAENLSAGNLLSVSSFTNLALNFILMGFVGGGSELVEENKNECVLVFKT